MFETHKIRLLWEVFELFVLKPAGIARPEPPAGKDADPNEVMAADPNEVMARGFNFARSNTAGPPHPPIFDEVSFKHDRFTGGWWPAVAPTAKSVREMELLGEMEIIRNVEFLVQKVLYDPVGVLVGYPEKKRHHLQLEGVSWDWWAQEIKVDFYSGNLYVRDRSEPEGWRWMFSDLQIWRSDYWAETHSPLSPGTSEFPTGNPATIDTPRRAKPVNAERQNSGLFRRVVSGITAVREHFEENKTKDKNLKRPTKEAVQKFIAAHISTFDEYGHDQIVGGREFGRAWGEAHAVWEERYPEPSWGSDLWAVSGNSPGKIPWDPAGDPALIEKLKSLQRL